MSARAISLVEFAIAVGTQAAGAEVHSSGAVTLQWWFAEILHAAFNDDAAEVARLADMIREERELTYRPGWPLGSYVERDTL